MSSKQNEDVVVQLVSAPQAVTAERGGGGALGRRLLAAARAGNTGAVLELMAAGAPFAADWLGTSALHLAAAGAHAATAAVLLRAGVSRDARTKVERTPLHLAAHAGHAAVARLLLRHGAAVDARDMLRMTPLHWAAERGHAALAGLLVAHGADVAARSKFGKTPPQLARARGHRHVLRAIDDALRERAAPAAAPCGEPAAEVPAAEQRRALESIERLQESVRRPAEATAGVAAETEPDAETGAQAEVKAAAAEDSAAALLRRHGIALLPRDTGTTVLTALQHGRTVVLSDAGKLMLKDTVPPPPPAPTPPAPLKIYTINDNVKPAAKTKTVKKIINPHDLQIKLVNVPGGLKAKARQSPVKLVLNKASLGRLLAPAPAAPADEGALAAALRRAAALATEVAELKARLARYEPV